MEDGVVVLSGARLGQKGLHLGHFLGCFQPIITGRIEKYSEYFFVIFDEEKSEISESDIWHYIAEIYAVAKVFKLKNIHVVFEDDLVEKFYLIRTIIEKQTTCNQLFNSYRIEFTHARTIFSNRRVADMLFPLNQAALNIAFNASYICMNDDNLRIIEFSRDTNKKIIRICGDIALNMPELVTGEIPHLLGYNYKKMCNGNENAIYLDDSTEVIERKVHQLFNHKRYFQAYPEEYEKFKKTDSYQYSEKYLPIMFMDALFPDMEKSDGLLMKKERSISEENYLKKPLVKLIDSIRNETIRIQESGRLQLLMEMDLKNAMKICNRNINVIMGRLNESKTINRRDITEGNKSV